MKMQLTTMLCALAVAGCATDYGMTKKSMAEKKMVNMAHVHMGHVDTGWKDTPGKGGLLPTAIREAKIAVQHATFATKKNNLKWIRAHTWHVAHAVNPKVAPKGPGLGYGVRRAAAGAAAHIGFAAKSKGANKNIKAHSVHVATSANNVISRSDRIVALAKMVQSTRSVRKAHKLSHQILVLSQQLLAGLDANGDGKISWSEGEGGLNQAAAHMGFMRAGEKKMMKAGS